MEMLDPFEPEALQLPIVRLADLADRRVGEQVCCGPGAPEQIGDLLLDTRLKPVDARLRAKHRVVIDAPDGSRLAYTGDTGPSASVEEAVRDADLLLVESALGLAAHDDPERGHLTPEEAIELARRANARAARSWVSGCFPR